MYRGHLRASRPVLLGSNLRTGHWGGGGIAQRQHSCFSPSVPGFDSQCSHNFSEKINFMLPRLIDSALLGEWTVQSFIVHQTILVLASGMVELQKRTGHIFSDRANLMHCGHKHAKKANNFPHCVIVCHCEPIVIKFWSQSLVLLFCSAVLKQLVNINTSYNLFAQHW